MSMPPFDASTAQLQFDGYVLDLARGHLLQDGKDITLRPKTFSVLRHLVENAGRLVPKDELFSAVWPDVTVTDDTLVQSIGELRRALGEDGARLIKTVSRRGYRLDAEVSALGAHGPGTAPSGAKPTTTPRRSPASYAAVVLFLLVAAAAIWFGSRQIAFEPAPARDQVGSKPDATARPAIAILPFSNRSDDASRDYFAEGLTQDIIAALGRFSELTVLSWSAVSHLKNQVAKPADVARQLGTRYQVEGSVRHTGERVRVNAQLVDIEGRIVWSATFDEALADIFNLQDKITTQIAAALAIGVGQIEQRRVFAKPTANLEAYDYVLRARPALQRPTRGNIVEARAFLRRAIEIDPHYAAAYAALAETYYIATSWGWAESPTQFLNRAEELALKALSFDPLQVRARLILGRIYLVQQKYAPAEHEIDRVLAINPNDAQGLAGRGTVLVWLGQTDAAIAALEQAERIDPNLSTIDRFALGLAYYLKGRYDDAIEQAERNLRENPNAGFSRIVLAAAYAQANRAEDGARVVDAIRRSDPTFDAQEFGSKFLNSDDAERLRAGLRRAGFEGAGAARPN
jgi:adenylate cyclase